MRPRKKKGFSSWGERKGKREDGPSFAAVRRRKGLQSAVRREASGREDGRLEPLGSRGVEKRRNSRSRIHRERKRAGVHRSDDREKRRAYEGGEERRVWLKTIT